MSKPIQTPKIRKAGNGSQTVESRVTVLETLVDTALQFFATKENLAKSTGDIKEDLAKTKGELKEDIAKLKGDVMTRLTDQDKKIEVLFAKLDQKIEVLSAKQETALAQLHTSLLKYALGIIGAIIAAALTMMLRGQF